MEMSLSLIDLSRPTPAAQAHGAAGREAMPPSSSERREVGFAGAAVSPTQAGLMGRALMGATPPPAPSIRPLGAADLGEPRRAERVLAPWGVPMLPSDAASEARRVAAREAALRGRIEAGTVARRPEEAEVAGPLPSRGTVPRTHNTWQVDQPPGIRERDAARPAAGSGVPREDAPALGAPGLTTR